jgi:hypothetical protein
MEIDYKEWLDRCTVRRQELEDELAKLKPLLAYLAPLAEPEHRIQQVPETTDPEADTPPVQPETIGGTSDTSDEAESQGSEPRVDYSKMPATEAALHYMRSVEGPQTTGDVVKALLAGGFKTESPHFGNNVYTTMRRLVGRGDVVRIGQGEWMLTAQGATREAATEIEPESEQAELVG